MALDPQFDHVLQFLPHPYLIILPDAPKFTIVTVNDAYLKSTNTTENDLIGKGIFEAFPENPEDRISKSVDNLRNSLNTVISQKESHKIPLQKYDIPIRGTSNFMVKYYNSQNIPIKDDNNIITHILHSVEDLTDKQQLELSLEIERQRFKDLYFQAPSSMAIVKGPDHVYELANPLYLELVGAKDVIGKTVKEVLPELESQGVLEMLNTVYETGVTFIANEIFVQFDYHNNGVLVDTYLNYSCQANRNYDGTIAGIFIFATDVTELVMARKEVEESKESYKELIQNLPVAAYSCDHEGRILLYNKAAAALWGREPKIGVDKWSGAWKIYSTDGKLLPIDLHPISIALKEGRQITDQEIIVERPNGDKLNIVPHPVPLFDSSGRVRGAVKVLLDITERKKTDEKLRKLIDELACKNEENEKRATELSLSNKELVKTNKELDRLVYSVSHDLRSPLTSILGLVSFIEDESKEADTLEQVKMIKGSIHRLDKFIKNILNYSQNNRTGLETKKIPLKKTIHEIVDSVRNIKAASGISFEIDINEKHSFYSDWQRFNTVVENLVSNAIKYHTQEISGRYLKLTATSDRDELNLSIADNGMGIDPEFHDKIFEMFYRLPGNAEGSGIGLYIVKETVEKMQGTIEIDSEKGVGTTFNIKLKNLEV